jgi:hypothetical protein
MQCEQGDFRIVIFAMSDDYCSAATAQTKRRPLAVFRSGPLLCYKFGKRVVIAPPLPAARFGKGDILIEPLQSKSQNRDSGKMALFE